MSVSENNKRECLVPFLFALKTGRKIGELPMNEQPTHRPPRQISTRHASECLLSSSVKIQDSLSPFRQTDMVHTMYHPIQVYGEVCAIRSDWSSGRSVASRGTCGRGCFRAPQVLTEGTPCSHPTDTGLQAARKRASVG